jgi:hypothetical protein
MVNHSESVSGESSKAPLKDKKDMAKKRTIQKMRARKCTRRKKR